MLGDALWDDDESPLVTTEGRRPGAAGVGVAEIGVRVAVTTGDARASGAATGLS